MSGSRRGAVDTLSSQRVVIGTAAEATAHFVTEREPMVHRHHAEVLQRGGRLRIRSLGGSVLHVNGKPVEDALLMPGDVIRIGDGGPLLRYRVYCGTPSPYKRPVDALSDCFANARHSGGNLLGQARTFAGLMPGEIGRLPPAFRWTMILVMALVLIAMGGLGYHSYRLEQRLEQRTERLATVSARLDETRRRSVEIEAVEALRDRLSGTLQRLDDLESRLGAPRQVIADAAHSIIFIQGAYGFEDPETGERLRLAVDADGEPREAAPGKLRVRVGGDGPAVERSYIGTGFVADTDGLILTNRHVAEPWAFDKRAQKIIQRGLEVLPIRRVGYLPGRSEPFQIEFVAAADGPDLAVLRAAELAGEVTPLPLAERSPEAGDEVILLGYPTGINALLARADPKLVQRLSLNSDMDFWQVTAELSEHGAIEPLATSGIVGQVTRRRVVYDAGTTGGGSGGPLLDHTGHVLAVNQAMVEDFAGSNLGIPVEHARDLLSKVQAAR